MSALLRTKRTVWFISLCLASVVLLFSYASGRKYANALQWVQHTERVTMSLERVLSSLRDQESAMRGFVLTGDESLLGGRAGAILELEAELENCQKLVRDDAVQSRRVAALALIVDEKLGFIRTVIEERRRHGLSAASQVVAGRGGVVLMDRIRAAVSELQGEQLRLLGERRRVVSRIQRQSFASIAAVAMVMLALLAGSFLAMQRDASELKQAALELAESEERYRVLVENVSDLVMLHGGDGALLFVSPSIEKLLGYSVEEARALAPLALLHAEDAPTVRYHLEKFRMGDVRSGLVTCRLERRDGEYRWFEFKVNRVDDGSGNLRHFQSAGRDVTVRRRLEQRLATQAEELRNLSLRDGLTGLYNRRGFLELSAPIVRLAERERHNAVLLFVDLDGLKEINDRLGHGHGDRAINEAADVLRTTCRASDLVARLGGDEFVVLAGNVDDHSVTILTNRIRAGARRGQSAGRP